MGRKRKSSELLVALNGRKVGTLSRAVSGAIRFDYAPEWRDWEYAIPVSLSMPIADRPYTGMSVNAVFENLLPDDERIRTRIAEQVGAEGTDAFSLLSVLGRDCIGALQFLPQDETPSPPGEPEGEEISDAALAARIRSLRGVPLGVEREDTAFRISLAGAQDKTALLQHDGKWLLPRGTTPTTHILKPQIGMVHTMHGEVDMHASVQNEHFCMTLIRELGLPVAKSEIIEPHEGMYVLSVERFDRRIDDRGRLLRLPQEDLCQALGVSPSQKYEERGGPGLQQCLDLLRGSNDPLADRHLFLKAQIAFWMTGATDGHAKNFSIFLSPQGRYALTPLYDILSTQWQFDRRQIPQNRLRLAMAVGNNRYYQLNDILPRHWEQTAHHAGLPRDATQSVMEELVGALSAAGEAARQAMPACVSEEMMQAVLEGAQRRAEDIEFYLGE